MTKPRRRQAGEGGINEYVTKAGVRYSVLFYVPDENGHPKRAQKRGFTTRKDAAKALRDIQRNIERNTYVKPSRGTVADWLQVWTEGLRLRPSTVASYERNIRLHVIPHIGALKLEAVTGARLTKLYKDLETAGGKGNRGGAKGLSARTVRYIHTIISAALRDAVHEGLLVVNPADKSKPPTAAEAKAPEMHAWSPDQARTFLTWAWENRPNHAPMWSLLLSTGMRRGELIGLRWSDIDLVNSAVSVRRTVGVIKDGTTRLVEGPTKTGRSRTVNIGVDDVVMLRKWKADRGTVGLGLVRQSAHVFGKLDGSASNPDAVADAFVRQVAAAQVHLGSKDKPATDAVPTVRLHDLRHTHATALLRANVPAKVVSERLGHTDVMTTLRVYQHVLPGMQAEAASTWASLMGSA
ncbi:site-specific integrase [Arthrobacter tecti]